MKSHHKHPAPGVPVHAPVAPRPPLPNARHLSLVPPDITPAQIEAIRNASFSLPQVVKPADFIAEGTAGFEKHLDDLGYVLLQKSVPGQRPSRWIHPSLMHAALAHLAAMAEAHVPNQAQRALMLERTTALESQGVARRAGVWTRLIRHSLVLAEPGWKVPVLFRMPVPIEAVFAFFRQPDVPALQAALGAPAQHPQAAELIAHLNTLVATSRALRPTQLDGLLPRLQAEGGRVQSTEELLVAFTRAQQRWEQQAAEQDTLAGLTSELAFSGYPESFPKARRANRRIRLFVGPPNSGKTYAAFERLAQSLDGAYLAPLRLLALEGRDRLVARGVPCSLLTGEENVPAEGARVISSTIEMVGTNTPIDVAVIDEAQMIFDHSRGWAWTQAIVAVPASEVIIICSAYAVPAITNLLGLCGESPEVQHFERKQQVQLLPTTVGLNALQEGDAIVAFSRRDVLTLRDNIAASGHAVSVIYGALPPEVRRREAERFAGGESKILVATDAIGMGLNLPIRRVLFSTMTKFDGVDDRLLDVSEVHQIAGRAGRYGMHEEGFVGVLREAEPAAFKQLKELLPRQPRAPRDFKAPVAPNGWHVKTIEARMGKEKLGEVLRVFVEQLRLDDAHFAVAELEQMTQLAEELDRCAAALPLHQRFTYAQAPVDSRNNDTVQQYLGWAAGHAAVGQAGRPFFLDTVDGHSRLDAMEQALRACTLWLWLDLRFPGIYGHLDEVLALRAMLNDGIERQLKGKRPLAQRRMRR